MIALHESLPGLPPLIPRELIFGNPQKEAARISPDGTLLAYLAPSEGKQSVWVSTIGGQDDRVVAHDPARPIPWAAWQGDGRHVLYLQDRAGDENYHLCQVDVNGGAARDLTPGENIRAMPLAMDHHFPNAALITMNARNAKLFDVHRIDFTSGTTALDTENPGDVMLWLADHALVVRAAVAMLADGSSAIRVRDDARSPWRVLDDFSFTDGPPSLVAFSPDNRAIYVITAKDANASRLVQYDLATATSVVLFDDGTYDVERAYVDLATNDVVAVAVLGGGGGWRAITHQFQNAFFAVGGWGERVTWHALTQRFDAAFAALGEVHVGDISIEDSSADGKTLIVRFRSDAHPDDFFAYDLSAGRASLLFCNRPELLEHTLAPMEPITFAARDGLQIQGYLTLPVGVEPRNLPTVLYVHGGPWHRDRWGYEPMVQWLGNRGYAVLQVNFRGSTGYGRAFLNAGNREWAGAMRTDLLDARDWVIAQGYADPNRFAIFGGSYGGYAVLAALTFTPDAFTCGIDVVGPSNLHTCIAAIPSYWEPMRKLLTERVGEDPEFLNSQSPLFKAASIRVPLLIAQGANDPRVKQQESDQIVAVLRSNKIPVQYVVFENEGHGFADPANNKRFTALAEAFLAETLGGRFEALHAGEESDAFLR